MYLITLSEYSSNPDKKGTPVRTTIGISKRGEYADRDFFELGEKSLGQTVTRIQQYLFFNSMGSDHRGFNGNILQDKEKRQEDFMK